MQTNLDNTNFNHDGQSLDGEALKNRQSRLKKALADDDIIEFNKLGGQIELDKVNKKLTHARNKINNNQEVTADTDYRNTYQKEANPMDIGNSPRVTKKSDHSGGPKSKIMTNSQALSEEIKGIRYLIEYMNNNNNKQNL